MSNHYSIDAKELDKDKHQVWMNNTWWDVRSVANIRRSDDESELAVWFVGGLCQITFVTDEPVIVRDKPQPRYYVGSPSKTLATLYDRQTGIAASFAETSVAHLVCDLLNKYEEENKGE